MAIFIIILIALLIGGVCGYKIATRVLRIEHSSLVRQNYMLTNWSNQWANSMQYHNQVEENISHRNNANLSNTMGLVIQLMAQLQQQTNLPTNDRKAIEDIIETAKGFSRSEFE